MFCELLATAYGKCQACEDRLPPPRLVFGEGREYLGSVCRATSAESKRRQGGRPPQFFVRHCKQGST